MAIHDKADQAIEQETVSFGTVAKEADFQSLCTDVTLHATEDCHISFDGEVATTGKFFLKGDVMIDIRKIKFTRLSVIQNSTGGTLYIMARRNW